MVKKKRGPGRPRKRGRPKGSRNKIIEGLKEALEFTNDPSIRKPVTFKYIDSEGDDGSDLSSRLDQCMTNLETAVAEAISKLKEMI